MYEIAKKKKQYYVRLTAQFIWNVVLENLY